MAAVGNGKKDENELDKSKSAVAARALQEINPPGVFASFYRLEKSCNIMKTLAAREIGYTRKIQRTRRKFHASDKDKYWAENESVTKVSEISSKFLFNCMHYEWCNVIFICVIARMFLLRNATNYKIGDLHCI